MEDTDSQGCLWGTGLMQAGLGNRDHSAIAGPSGLTAGPATLWGQDNETSPSHPDLDLASVGIMKLQIAGDVDQPVTLARSVFTDAY